MKQHAMAANKIEFTVIERECIDTSAYEPDTFLCHAVALQALPRNRYEISTEIETNKIGRPELAEPDQKFSGVTTASIEHAPIPEKILGQPEVGFLNHVQETSHRNRIIGYSGMLIVVYLPSSLVYLLIVHCSAFIVCTA